MDAIRIPVGAPLTFDDLKRLNPETPLEDLAVAFAHLPGELREQAWDSLRLRVALQDWNAAAEEPAP